MMNADLKLSDSKFVRYFKTFTLQPSRHYIGFYGNFGHGDLGDDASFYVAKQFLGEDVLPISKRAYSFNPRLFKALCVGGGGIFRWECPYIPRRIDSKEKWDFPVVLLSSGINCDFSKKFSQEALDKISELCKRCDYITVRDNLTVKFLNDLGFNSVALMPDLELLLEPKEVELPFEKKGKPVGIVISPHSAFRQDKIERMINGFAEFINACVGNGKQVIIFPFDLMQGDTTTEENYIQKILALIEDPSKVDVIKNTYQPQELLYLMNSLCDSCICMRLHSAVFAANAGIPFVCVSFNKMHQGFLELLNWQDLEVPFDQTFNGNGLLKKFHTMIASHSTYKHSLESSTEGLRQQIKEQFQKIIRVIS